MKRLKRLVVLGAVLSAFAGPGMGHAEEESISTVTWAREVIMRADGLNGAWFAGDLKVSLLDGRTGDGIAGQTITFLHGTTPFCQAKTNDLGVANCTDPIAQLDSILNRGYTARFDGNGPLQASQDSAGVAHILGTDV